jgi:hypothetical protein
MAVVINAVVTCKATFQELVCVLRVRNYCILLSYIEFRGLQRNTDQTKENQIEER